MNRNFDGIIIYDIEDLIRRYGYAFVEIKKSRGVWSIHYSGLDYPYRITSKYLINNLENFFENDEFFPDDIEKMIQSFFTVIKNIEILKDSLLVSNVKISCILYRHDTSFHRIDSIDSLIKSISGIKKKNSGLSLYFRGELAKWIPIPSLFRNRQYVINEVCNDEKVISLVPDEFINCKTDFDKLVKLKHYSEPSRLLDLTKSPLVALFFALECMENNTKELGIIRICFSNPEKEKIASISDTVSLITGVAKTSAKKCKYYDETEKDCNKCETAKEECDYFTELQYRVRHITNVEYDWKNRDIKKDINKCVIVHPPYNNYRIVQQQGLFVFCGRNTDDIHSCPDSIMRIWRNPKTRNNEYLYIMPEMVKTLKRELQSLGIDKYFLYGSLENEIESVVNTKE